MRVRHSALVAAGTIVPAIAATAQPPCGNPGPDVMIGNISAASNYAVAGAIDAFSLGTAVCNIGATAASYISHTNQHPLVTQGLYRLQTVGGAARFEQIGMSWCYHTFFALSQQLCCPLCIPTDGTTLGVGCADPTTSHRLGSQHGLGPRYQVNAATGAFSYPPANPAWSGTVARRLQARVQDLEPAFNPGARYFVQHLVIAPDDAAAGNAANNSSYRPCTISPSTPADGFTLAPSGATQRGRAAVHAWSDADPGVVLTQVLVPGDGLFLVAARATRVAPATWRYEYALENLTSDRSAGSVSVPLPPGANLVVHGAGFHDVDYHSGDGGGNRNFDGTDWPGVVTSTALTWSTAEFDANPNANAVRWGTVYNFRFDANAAPLTGSVTIGLFKPGTPAAVDAALLPVPGPPCAADWHPDGVLNSQDFFDFLADFFGGAADVNGNGVTDSQDFFDFLAMFFGGC